MILWLEYFLYVFSKIYKNKVPAVEMLELYLKQ